MPILNDLNTFDVENAALSLWVFKKSVRSGHDPSFKGRWVETSDDLEAVLKETIISEREKIEELEEYGLLTQNNEASALTISVPETHAGLVVDQLAAETDAKKVDDLKHIRNSVFYIVKLVSGDDILHSVKKADASWKTKKARNMHSVFFADDQLGLDDKPTFDLAKNVDFFVLGEDIVIRHKTNFESVLNYKQAHKDDFAALQGEQEFIDVFADFAPLIAYVGENKIQLRRASAIRQKGHYKNPDFMANLRARHAEYGLNLQFDAEGKIVATSETCRDVVLALLDHRLVSGFSHNIYDVPDTKAVQL